jgi:hypothetical protein
LGLLFDAYALDALLFKGLAWWFVWSLRTPRDLIEQFSVAPWMR